MPSVPRANASRIIAAFIKAGFREVRQKGSHRILKKDGHKYLLSIPDHGNKDVGVGLLRKQIDAAGLTVDEFIALLD